MHIKHKISRNTCVTMRVGLLCKCCELNFYDQKIQRTLTHDTRKHWTAVSTLLGLISCVYHDLHHWRLNQKPQIAEPKLYNWATFHILEVTVSTAKSTDVTCKTHSGQLAVQLPWQVNLAALVCNMAWWDLRSKQLSSVSVCCV